MTMSSQHLRQKASHSMLFDCSDDLEGYPCSKCGLSFPLKCDLLRHLKANHKPTSDEPKSVKCHKCPFTTHSKLISAKHFVECAVPLPPQAPHSLLTQPLTSEPEDVPADQPVYDMVCCLLKKPFRRRPKKEQGDIVLHGRPFPYILIDYSMVFDSFDDSDCSDEEFEEEFLSPEDSDRHSDCSVVSSDPEDCFAENSSCEDFTKEEVRTICYIEHPWLCGSHYLKRVFCWPCLLFCDTETDLSIHQLQWTKEGISDFGDLTSLIEEHETSSEHSQCSSNLRRFRSRLIGDSPDDSVAAHNETVLKNRFLAEMLVRAALFVVRQGREEVGDMYRDLMVLMLTLSGDADSAMKTHYDAVKRAFPGDYDAFYDEVVECVAGYVRERVRSELRSAEFVSFRCDDAFPITGRGRCSATARFVGADGAVVERFLGFYDVFDVPDCMYEVVRSVIEEYGCEGKLVSQSYDGGNKAVIAVDLVQRLIKEGCGQAHFVHCHEHRLELLIEQNLRNTFLSEFIFNFRELRRILPSLKAMIDDWTVSDNIYGDVWDKWELLRDSLARIEEEVEEYRWEVAMYSRMFLRDLDRFYFAFFTKMMAEIFEKVLPLSDVLRQSRDVAVWRERIFGCYRDVEGLKTEKNCEEWFELARSRSALYRETYDDYRKMFSDVLDEVLMDLEIRFRDLIDMDFLKLADTSRFKAYSVDFPEDLCDNLYEFYPVLFADLQNLKNELLTFYQVKKYHGKDLENVVKMLNKNGLHRIIFGDVYKLFCLVLTLPVTKLKGKKRFKTIKTCSLDSVEEVLESGSLNPLFLQGELLDELTKPKEFYDEIIDRFVALGNKPVDLLYKE